MSTRKKRHLIAGTIIGGLLLAATTQTGNSFALSDTSSSSTSNTPTTSQQTPATSTNSVPTTPTAPTDATADGSKATQISTTAAGVNSLANPSSTASSSSSSPTDPPTGPKNSDLANSATASNTVNSKADTGDASVKHTADGGNATSGNASAGTTLINNIASSSNLNSGTLQTFNYNINGTKNGDVVINPDDIVTKSNVSAPTPADCLPASSTTADNNATVNNLVTLLAQTGNTKVSDNGVGGDATSGNATTEANIINTIQGLVSDKGAFLGVINVNGDLNGNIELPASVINSLLTPTSGGSASGNASATNNSSINNNVTLTAITGNAAVVNNGTGGSATSGNASTILQTCNLINSNIVGGNLLLVFVNVMGHWYGALLSEPAGDTTATLGGGITQDTVTPSLQTTATNNAAITNNLNLTSISGNATVANNGVGGNATTGSATAIADITNILGSQINLSGWLGILVINVFGTWNGSLVIQPIAVISSNTGSTTHQQDTTYHSSPVDLGNGAGYSIAEPPQSFDAGQFDLTAAHALGTNTAIANNNMGSTTLQTAVKTNHGTPAKRFIVDSILAGVGIAFTVIGAASRFFANRRSSL